MSFQAYLDNIQAKTGKSPADFSRLATEKGFAVGCKLKPGVKAGAVVALTAQGRLRARTRPRNGDRGTPQRQEGRRLAVIVSLLPARRSL
jgi:hypothetical protein